METGSREENRLDMSDACLKPMSGTKLKRTWRLQDEGEEGSENESVVAVIKFGWNRIL